MRHPIIHRLWGTGDVPAQRRHGLPRRDQSVLSRQGDFRCKVIKAALVHVDRCLKIRAPHVGIWPPRKPPTGLGRAACREKDNDDCRLRFPAAGKFVARRERVRPMGRDGLPEDPVKTWRANAVEILDVVFSGVVARLRGSSPPERGEQKANLRKQDHSRKRHVRNDRALPPFMMQKGVSGLFEISLHGQPPPWTCSSDTPVRHQTLKILTESFEQ